MHSIRGCLFFFFFCEKLFRTSYVCPTQTTCRRLSLQCAVCLFSRSDFIKKGLPDLLFLGQMWTWVF
ncbi:hypothetical protein HanRHA438_Chr09g0381041 [Helianthus annuus]|nr:hypothetical protein HanRHA438_Chr09g0381041 [Helianthus annuus]